MSVSFIILASYLIGCITTGYYLVHLLTGQDIRTKFSGNPGSRNVGRLMGVKGFILTFIGDAGKGFIAVWLAQKFSSHEWISMAALLAVTAGHIWPVQLKFKGGKGMATYAGGMILAQPEVMVLGLGLCILIYPLTRKTISTGLIALAATPIIMAILIFFEDSLFKFVALSLYFLLVSIILFAHHSDIKNIFNNN